MDENHATLEQAKQAQLEALKISYAAAMNFEVELDGHKYQADSKSYSEVIAAVSQETLPDNFYWLDAQNVKVAFDQAKLKQLSHAIFSRRLELFNILQDKKEGVRTATEVSQVFMHKP